MCRTSLREDSLRSGKLTGSLGNSSQPSLRNPGQVTAKEIVRKMKKWSFNISSPGLLPKTFFNCMVFVAGKNKPIQTCTHKEEKTGSSRLLYGRSSDLKTLTEFLSFQVQRKTCLRTSLRMPETELLLPYQHSQPSANN